MNVLIDSRNTFSPNDKNDVYQLYKPPLPSLTDLLTDSLTECHASDTLGMSLATPL